MRTVSPAPEATYAGALQGTVCRWLRAAAATKG